MLQSNGSGCCCLLWVLSQTCTHIDKQLAFEHSQFKQLLLFLSLLKTRCFLHCHTLKFTLLWSAVHTVFHLQSWFSSLQYCFSWIECSNIIIWLTITWLTQRSQEVMIGTFHSCQTVTFDFWPRKTSLVNGQNWKLEFSKVQIIFGLRAWLGYILKQCQVCWYFRLMNGLIWMSWVWYEFKLSSK